MPAPAPRTPVIGILGAIASGKSAVTRALAALGAAVHDADKEVGELLNAPEVLERIAREVDPRAVAGGALDRKALADAVFADADTRAALEAILHPPVLESARRLARNPPPGASAVVIDAPLLIEAGLDALCDELWYVDTPREVRVRRASDTRGWSEDELDRRERAQIPLEEKRGRADRVIDNSGSLDELEERVASAWRALNES